MNNMKSKWFRYKSKNPIKGHINLFCFPHAGGSAQLYKEWAKLAEPQTNVYPIQLPMRENRGNEILPKSIEEVIMDFLKENESIFNEPYAVFGHSLGAILAVELVYELKKRGKNCHCLFISGTSYPKGKKATLPFTEREIMDNLYNLGGINEELVKSEVFMRYYMPIISGDLELFSNYEWKHGDALLDCPLYLFGGKQDQSVSVEQMHTWKDGSSNYLGETFFTGGHFYLKQNAKNIMCIIQNVLKEGD